MQINLIDKSFKSQNASNYHLSVQVDKDFLSYCVYDPERTQYVVLRNYRLEKIQLREDLLNGLAGIFVQDDLLDLPYQSVRLMYYSQLSTLIPEPYFDHKHLKDYFNFNHSMEPTDDLFYNYIQSIGTWNVFAIPSTLVALIGSQFKQPVFVHQATAFLQPPVNRHRFAGSHSVIMGINHDFFDIAVFHHDKLLLYNSYQYVNETDLLYFVLFVYKEMELDLHSTPLFISGEMSSKLIYFETLKQYIHHLHHANATDSFKLAPGLFSMSLHKFLNLLNMHHCVSSVENTKEGKLQ